MKTLLLFVFFNACLLQLNAGKTDVSKNEMPGITETNNPIDNFWAWFIANQDVLSALQFSGYDVKFEWGDGEHNSRHATALFPDALRWLWRDYPAPIKANADWYNAYASKNPMNRWASPDEMVGPTLFLASDAASYVNGSIIYADGGWLAQDGRFTPPGM